MILSQGELVDLGQQLNAPIGGVPMKIRGALDRTPAPSFSGIRPASMRVPFFPHALKRPLVSLVERTLQDNLRLSGGGLPTFPLHHQRIRLSRG
jgi:hypothetical protein